MNIINIIEGNLRVVLNIRTPIMEYREENYCKKCPVSHVEGKYTGICVKNNGGCGCGAAAKTSQNGKGCPKNFWGNDWFKEKEFKEFAEDQSNW